MAGKKEAGVFQAFPRDDAAIAMIKDGRWKIEPHPVEWGLEPKLRQPLGIRRAPGLGITAALLCGGPHRGG